MIGSQHPTQPLPESLPRHEPGCTGSQLSWQISLTPVTKTLAEIVAMQGPQNERPWPLPVGAVRTGLGTLYCQESIAISGWVQGLKMRAGGIKQIIPGSVVLFFPDAVLKSCLSNTGCQGCTGGERIASLSLFLCISSQAGRTCPLGRKWKGLFKHL